jgi:glycogen operon protein
MTDAAWNASSVRSLGVLMVGNVLDEIDERGRPLSGDTLLILLNADFDDLSFVLPTIGSGHAWVRVIDTIESDAPELPFCGGTTYELHARSIALFTLDGRRGRRVLDTGEAVQPSTALQVLR